MDRSTKWKINKETQAVNDIMDQLDLFDFTPKQWISPFFKCPWNILQDRSNAGP